MRIRDWFYMFMVYLVFLSPFFTRTQAAIAFDRFEPAPRILFDDSHGQSFGNADWTPEHAYSDLADDLRSSFNASVFSSGRYSDGIITPELLNDIDLLIIPEPNIRYTYDEKQTIRRFVSSGGSLFLIADHGGSDRNFDGWDSCLIFNDLTEGWGISFLGDTFSETPVRGRRVNRCKVINCVKSVGAWAATSIIIDPGSWHWLSILASEKTGFPFIVRGDVGMGRVVAMGDSSAFDDGSGDTTKNRHSAYHSWMFDQRCLAIRAAAWLLDQKPEIIPEKDLPFPDRKKNILKDIDKTEPRLIIDACRGNNDADLMDRFARQISQELNLQVFLNLDDYIDLRPGDILLISNPSTPLSTDDISTLSDWIREDGGKLILTGASARNPLCSTPDLNALLTSLDASMRLNADQILDHGSNTGKPWSPKLIAFAPSPVFEEVDSAVFWGAASVINTDGTRLRNNETVTVLAWTSPEALSEVNSRFTVKGGQKLSRNPKTSDQTAKTLQRKILPDGVTPAAIPAAALEKIGEGTVILLGADPFTNFQYPTDQEKETMEPIKWDHTTANFNLALLRILVKM